VIGPAEYLLWVQGYIFVGAFARGGGETPSFVDFLRKMANHNYGFWLLTFTGFVHGTTIAH
jgi:hypothetical protein